MTENSQSTKNQVAWLAMNNEYGLLDQVGQRGVATLTADQIIKYRETRLLTKIDERTQLPPFLRDNDLCILPTSRNSFLVGHFEAFADLPNLTSQKPKPISDSDLLTLQLRHNTESSGILVAIDTGMIESFLHEAPAKLGIIGRMGSGSFTFKVAGYDKLIAVNSSQIEIDAGIETPKSVVIMEAKASERGSFLIRQLYYPWRTWSEKIGKKKDVRPVFLVISNDRFSLVEYQFTDLNVYSSIELVRHETFQLIASVVTPAVVDALLRHPLLPVNNNVPYPQADSFDRIISLLVSMDESDGTLYKDDVAAQQVFHKRQADYYLNAAEYLGLVEERDRKSQLYGLTVLGTSVVSAGPALRSRLLIERLLADPVIRPVFGLARQHPITPRSSEVHQEAEKVIRTLMKSGQITNLDPTKSTPERRAKTLVAWCAWIVEHVQW
jgi:hypothetical protein